LSDFGAAPTKFDVADLSPLTARFVSALSADDVAPDVVAAGVPNEIAHEFWDAVRENVQTRDDIAVWWALCRDGVDPLVDPEDQEFVTAAMALLPLGALDQSSWSTWTSAVKEATGRKGKGLFMPLRKALIGSGHGPDMAKLLPMLQVIRARA
jgi:glutamyl-tRNA synthetase